MKQIKYGFLFVGLLCFVASMAMGCESSYKAKKPEAVKAAEKVQKDEKKAAEETAKKAEAAKVAKAEAKTTNTAADDVSCWGKDDPKASIKAIDIDGQKFNLINNYRLEAAKPDLTKPLVIGVLTDIKNNIASNMKNLEGFYAEFKKAGVNAVVVSGDTAEKYAMLKPLFEFFGKKGLLTMVIIGNREAKNDYAMAISEAAKKYPNLINLNTIRSVDLGAMTFVSMPGYYDANYIHNGPGCAYTATHVDATKKLVLQSKDPVALISHGPPRGVGKNAIDNAIEAGNVGDPRLTQLIKETGINLGFFGNIHEAGGKAVSGGEYNKALEQNKDYSNLYIHPGPADSDPWKMNDGTISRGMAGIVTVKVSEKGEVSAQYRILKAK